MSTPLSEMVGAANCQAMRKVCEDFEEAMKQCQCVTQQTSTTRKEVEVDGAKLWMPPDADASPIARTYYDRGRQAHGNRDGEGHLSLNPRLVFKPGGDEATFMQILRSNILAMWVAWETFALKVGFPAHPHTRTRARARSHAHAHTRSLTHSLPLSRSPT
jgi:hypothetical protein